MARAECRQEAPGGDSGRDAGTGIDVTDRGSLGGFATIVPARLLAQGRQGPAC